MKTRRTAKAIREHIRDLEKAGFLKLGQKKAVEKAWQKMWKAVERRDWKAVEASVAELAKALAVHAE